MTEQIILARREYTESEFKKWKEEYHIPFQKEFEVMALIDLQYTYATTSSDHIKTKKDLLDAMLMIKKELGLASKGSSKVFLFDINKYGEQSRYTVKVAKLDKNIESFKWEYLYDTETLDATVYRIIESVKTEKPTKVYFEKSGVGTSVTELFNSRKRDFGIRINKKGDLAY